MWAKTLLCGITVGWLILTDTTIAEPKVPAQPTGVEAIATDYVKLVLAMGQHDRDYVDAFYGPAAWKSAAEREKKPLDAIGPEATKLREELGKISAPTDEISRFRREYLTKQLAALEARVRMLQGERLKFDEESRVLYDAVAPALPESRFEEVLSRLDKALGGTMASPASSRTSVSAPDDGKQMPLWQRYEEWRKPFLIPKEKINAVFQLAIKQCRIRTLANLKLSPDENFTLEYVTNKPWGAYNWYKGNYRSVIQVNTDLPIYIDRAMDVAAHEGYPGHHVYNALLEKNFVRDRGWVEFSVYALFSPQSLIAEGTANFGKEVVFTKLERVKFEKEALFPTAGIDPARAAEYYAVQELVDQLAYARNEAARRLINGEIDANAAAAWLERYGLMNPARAKQAVEFIERYGSYVINYNLGEDMVRSYIEKGVESRRAAETCEECEALNVNLDEELRWSEFEQLLSLPRLPSGLN